MKHDIVGLPEPLEVLVDTGEWRDWNEDTGVGTGFALYAQVRASVRYITANGWFMVRLWDTAKLGAAHRYEMQVPSGPVKNISTHTEALQEALESYARWLGDKIKATSVGSEPSYQSFHVVVRVLSWVKLPDIKYYNCE